MVVSQHEEEHSKRESLSDLYHLAKNLRQKGLLTDEEYAIIDTTTENYQPLFGTLLSENDLL